MAAVIERSTGTCTREELARRWAKVLADPVLRNLPFRMELNKWGHVEMTPAASPGHMRAASRLGRLLHDALGGDAFTECAIVTPGGVRVADVVWCSAAFLQRHREALATMEASLAEAPEICVEVTSPSNSYDELVEKAALYLAAGAEEAWVVREDFSIRVFDAQGGQERSRFAVDLAQLRSALQSL
jgi:Uma2 family endonuclease